MTLVRLLIAAVLMAAGPALAEAPKVKVAGGVVIGTETPVALVYRNIP